MLSTDKGTYGGSELFFQTPSDSSRQVMYVMTSCGLFHTNRDYHIVRDNYYNYLLIYIFNGSLYVREQNKECTAARGQVVFLNCQVPHEYRTIRECDFIFIHIDGPKMYELKDLIINKYDTLAFNSEVGDKVMRGMQTLFYAARDSQIMQQTWISATVYSILMALAAPLSAISDSIEGDTVNPMVTVKNYIEQNYGKKIKLDELADVCKISKYHMIRLFNKEFGCTPYEYLMMTRINRAKYLLKTTEKNIDEIAYEIGFGSYISFSNMFKEKTGISPKMFRKLT